MSETHKQLLIVAKNTQDRQVVRNALKDLGTSHCSTQADGFSQALAMVSRHDFAAVVVHPSLLVEQSVAMHAQDQEISHLQSLNDRLKRENRRFEELYETAYRFVDNVSHEFRTPLTVIKEFTSILRDGLDGPTNQQQQQHLEIIGQRVEELTAIVNEMFELSQLEAGKLVLRRCTCHFDEIAQRVRCALERKAEKKGCTIEVHVEQELPAIYCDPEKVGRVIVHLVDHSLATLPADGRLELHVSADAAGWQIVVEIADNGPGLDEEQLRSIRSRFATIESNVRSSPKGLDLGLNIAKELVHLNLGQIHVDSQYGLGTKYRFTVPLADVARVAARYLERLRQLTGKDLAASLVAANVDQSVASDLADEVDEFLQRVLRCGDLVFRLDNHVWLLLTAGESHDAERMILRIEQQRRQANRNRTGLPLPRIQLGIKDRWDFGSRDQHASCSWSGEDTFRSRGEHAARVLLVDDDRHVVQGAAIRLQASGFDVLTAYDGPHAVQRAVRERPDAILLDICMPGSNGLETLKELRRRPETKDIPVAMITAKLSERSKALQLGAQHFLQKPYEASSLIEVVNVMTTATATSDSRG